MKFCLATEASRPQLFFFLLSILFYFYIGVEHMFWNCRNLEI